jgi:ketosteroid isomerase-like protein
LNGPEFPAPVAQILAGYSAAVAAKDAAALMGLYDAGVRIFDAWDRWMYQDAAAWQVNVNNWFNSLGDSGVRASFEDTRVLGAHPLWVVSSIITYAGVSSTGEVSHSMQNRLTWAIRLNEAGPKIIHEHTSAPIGFSDMKAILTR